MLVSVIVPAFNEEKLLPATLEAIASAAAGLHRHGLAHEVVVCDNNSTDQTADLARGAGARVVFEPLNQISRARNAGAGAAAGGWLVFVDADSQPCAALFGEVAMQILSGRVLGGGVTVRMEGVRGIGALLLAGWNRLSVWNRWVAGSFVFCEAGAFRELGGFSLELFASEEIEFSQRLKRLAGQRTLDVVILRQHPLLTSARKIHLYSGWPFLRMFLRTVFAGGRNLRRRAGCSLWYDGVR